MTINSSKGEPRQTILLLLAHVKDGFLIKEAFEPRYRVLSITEFDGTRDTFDLCIVDLLNLQLLYEITQRFPADPAVFRARVGLIGPHEVPETIAEQFDELIRLPCKKLKMVRRIEALLKINQLTNLNKKLVQQLETRVDELRIAEAKASELSASLQVLTDVMPQIVWSAMPDGRIDFLNEQWLTYSGVSFLETSARTMLHAIHPEDRSRVRRSYKHALRQTRTMEMELRLRRADGNFGWVLVRALPLLAEPGRVVKWIGSATDIDEQKKLQRLAQAASEAKSAFLANMSHEIRTPLGAIMGFSDLLKEPALSPAERSAAVDSISRNSHGLMRIIDDILDLAKVEANKIAIEAIEFSLPDLLAECFDLFRERAREKGLVLSLQIDPEVPRSILSDPTRLRQILVNLLGNAIKFTTAGEVSLTVQAERVADRDFALSIAVKDSGIGLTEEQKNRLFEPFTQADSSTNRIYGGTGLGLVLSRRLARALGGDIIISDGQLGQGSTFLVSLHVQEAAAQETREAIAEEALPSISGMQILVAEDSMDSQFLITRILSRSGAKVTTAWNGEEAIQKCLAASYDVVLMDIQMPHVDGYEATRALRGQGYMRPIIALTAHAMEEERLQSFAAGCDGHLTKPLNHAALLSVVGKFRTASSQHGCIT